MLIRQMMRSCTRIISSCPERLYLRCWSSPFYVGLCKPNEWVDRIEGLALPDHLFAQVLFGSAVPQTVSLVVILIAPTASALSFCHTTSH
jgi:hypothetical protein